MVIANYKLVTLHASLTNCLAAIIISTDAATHIAIQIGLMWLPVQILAYLLICKVSN